MCDWLQPALLFFFLMIRPPPRSPLFPYPTLFRSTGAAARAPAGARAPETRRAAEPVGAPPLRVVGHSVPRIDGGEKVTGRARYVTDLAMPGMAHAKVLRSPYAHARLGRVDASRARAHPGVLAVLTGGDLAGQCEPYYGPAFRDRPLLAIDVARYEGDPVDRKSTRLNSSHLVISYAVFCLKKKKDNKL